MGSGQEIIGRYCLYDELASGGMATVHIGRLIGPVGFARTVAIKKLHPNFAKDPEFVALFLDEARLAARIRHPNVVTTVDVVTAESQLFLVMDYVQGETLSRIVRRANARRERVPVPVVLSIVTGVLHGLHAAHEAKNDRGEPLHIVHRDVSPQNVIVGTDGVARVLDFGIAKSTARVQITRDGELKGKIAYMSPEQLGSKLVDRRTDVFATAIVLWEALTGRRLFRADDAPALVKLVMESPIEPPSSVAFGIDPALDAIVMKGLERDPDERWSTAREMAIAIERLGAMAPASVVGEFVERVSGELIAQRADRIAEIESNSAGHPLPPPSAESKTVAGPVAIPATPVGGDAAPRRSRGILVASVVLVLIVTSAAAFVLRGRAALPPASASVSNATPSAPETKPSSSPSPFASESSSAVASAPTIAPAPIAAPSSIAPKKPGKAPAAPAKTNCNPPYSFDAEGNKKYKRECL